MRDLLTRWSAVVRDLNPGAFAFVMASGIVASAVRGDGYPTTANLLLWVGVAGYLALIVVYGIRLLRWRRRLLADLLGPNAFAFLTFVAGSNVIAGELDAVGYRWTATALFLLGLAGWVVLGYGIPLGLVANPQRHPSLEQVNGTWFIWVVATQSIAVAGLALVPYGSLTPALTALASTCWAVGLVLYLLLAALALARLLLRPVTAKQLLPPYWVFMGSAAITVLAGAKLLSIPDADALLPHAVVAGASLVLWSFCTWLIPLLLALGVWRHLVRGEPLGYETGLWSVVFPVGMYGVASHHLGLATDIRWLADLGAGEAWAAVAVWLAVFVAMLGAALAVLVHPRRAEP